jgi:uncharacterized membrane protein YgcG
MRALFRGSAVAALLLLLAVPVLAQGRLIVTDPNGLIDRAAVERAAEPLLQRGALVAVYLVQSGGDADFVDRLIDDDLAQSSTVARSQMVALYVALDERYSAIRFGDEWNAALNVNDNFEQIRQNELNPGLADGDFTRGITDALGAIDAAIANPPDPAADTVINVDPAAAFNDFVVPTAAGAAVIAAGAAGGAVVIRRRRAAQARAAAQQRLKDAREQAGVLIADLGQRFKQSAEKARFDQVSYASGRCRATGDAAATRRPDLCCREDGL